jgi:hypothetical protein
MSTRARQSENAPQSPRNGVVARIAALDATFEVVCTSIILCNRQERASERGPFASSPQRLSLRYVIFALYGKDDGLCRAEYPSHKQRPDASQGLRSLGDGPKQDSRSNKPLGPCRAIS